MEDNVVKAYQLPKPSIVIDKKTINLKSDRINIKELYSKKDLTNLVILYDFKIKEINQIIDNITKAAKTYKINVDKPRLIKLPKEDYFNN